jgi:hypothetical protein
VELGKLSSSANPSCPWLVEQSSALGMALYSTLQYSTHNVELIHGYLTILIVSFAMSYAPSSNMIMFSLALSINIDLVCLRACSSSMPVHHHGGGSGGARVVILCTSVVL